jgi:hypothetical protein
MRRFEKEQFIVGRRICQEEIFLSVCEKLLPLAILLKTKQPSFGDYNDILTKYNFNLWHMQGLMPLNSISVFFYN